MSDNSDLVNHTWVREHIETYLAEGLIMDEAVLLEEHVRDCAPCASVLEEARRLDRDLNLLFAPVRPGADLEDRAVLKVRAGRPRGLRLAGWPRRALIAATVFLALGGIGALASAIPGGGLPVPGEVRRAVEPWLSMPGSERQRMLREARSLEETKEALLYKALPSDGTKVKLPEGMDMVSLPVSVSNAVAGFVVPGSKVDVLATLRLGNKLRAFPLLVDQQVLAVDQQATLETSKSGTSVLPNMANVSFAATQEQALVMALAKQRGAHLEVLLRHPGKKLDSDYDITKVMKMLQDEKQPAELTGEHGTGFAASDLDRPFPMPRPVDDRYTRNFNDFSAYSLTNPQFDPTAKPGKYFNANPYYAEINGVNWFKPGEHKFSLGIAPGVPAATPNQPPESKKNPDNNEIQPPKPAKAGQPVDPEPSTRRIVIRSGDMEFEVESFDSALATITKLVMSIKGAFVGTVNSEKLPNGKVKGSITVRTPPESLDGLVLDLRRELGKGGELKGIKIASQDMTKQYFDLESRLKAARTMETRLLQIIKEGKGEIKQLLEAEKELGVWRTKIEEYEGEIRYYSNLASLSTLTITLAEKEIRTAAGVTESERIQAGVEVEDVDKAYQQLLAAVVEMKGRVSKSDLKQLALGQFNAGLQFEVSPEHSGPMRDRLRQLGRVARLEIDRVQTAQGTVTKETRATRGDTVFVVQLYNVANVAPRETTVLSLAATDVAAAYHALRNAVAKTTGRVHAAQLNEQDQQNLSAQFDFEVRRSEEDAIRAELEKAGEVIARQVTRAPEGENVTDSKVLFRTAIVAANRLKPRELMAVSVQVADVEQAVSAVSFQASEAKARQIDSRINREPNGRVTAKLVYEVPLAAAASLAEQFRKTGTVREQQSVRDPSAPEGKFATARIDVTLKNEEKIVADDAGVWPPVKRGLTYSASVLLTSLTWVVVGLCVVLPWALVGYGGYRVVRWMGLPSGTTPTPAA